VTAQELESAALQFMSELDGVKAAIDPAFPWYPYGTLNNFIHLKPLLEAFPLIGLLDGGRVLDIGAADGDLAFFLERLGCRADVIDHAATNFNGLRGARLLGEHLKSSVAIHDLDLDSYFKLPAERYGLVFFLGILYHLKNPFLVLEKLFRGDSPPPGQYPDSATCAGGDPIRNLPVGYLMHATESNNDATNYWIFSEAGLLRLFDRTGWNVLMRYSVGDTSTSDPVRPDRDERCFALLASRQAKSI